MIISCSNSHNKLIRLAPIEVWSFIASIRMKRLFQICNDQIVVGDSRRTGGEPCGDTERYSVCLVFLNGTDLFVYCHEVMLCKSSGEYSEADII